MVTNGKEQQYTYWLLNLPVEVTHGTLADISLTKASPWPHLTSSEWGGVS